MTLPTPRSVPLESVVDAFIKSLPPLFRIVLPRRELKERLRVLLPSIRRTTTDFSIGIGSEGIRLRVLLRGPFQSENIFPDSIPGRQTTANVFPGTPIYNVLKLLLDVFGAVGIFGTYSLRHGS